ncbi:hypothetical protein B0T10DRAFT_465043 [Thelonectria olida]|uniref:Uncharacterized protein n=1 Tax=Thelonectria olida TaxID=1576542 RepID=A0A9P8VWP0_9HYPO|nr:hypothetical protein B0T10DRAFT_465043 [Thelonectria olida]
MPGDCCCVTLIDVDCDECEARATSLIAIASVEDYGSPDELAEDEPSGTRFRRPAAPSPEPGAHDPNEGAEGFGSNASEPTIMVSPVSSPILGDSPSSSERSWGKQPEAVPSQKQYAGSTTNTSNNTDSAISDYGGGHIASTQDLHHHRQSPTDKYGSQAEWDSEISLNREGSELPTEMNSPTSHKDFLSLLRPEPPQNRRRWMARKGSSS